MIWTKLFSHPVGVEHNSMENGMFGLFRLRQQIVETQKQKLHGDVSFAQLISIYISSFVVSAIVPIFLSLHSQRNRSGLIAPEKECSKHLKTAATTLKYNMSLKAMLLKGLAIRNVRMTVKCDVL
ncbi:hypothetical protein [uncultured Shewanella sp.]|uniref:hypothetical protein n=1 Tax=uncultured Shewanella sp. TaxID=173975 RepID=UPI002621C525|nr:hypothetical protein [uncultured Shewanella sp.]